MKYILSQEEYDEREARYEACALRARQAEAKLYRFSEAELSGNVSKLDAQKKLREIGQHVESALGSSDAQTWREALQTAHEIASGVSAAPDKCAVPGKCAVCAEEYPAHANGAQGHLFMSRQESQNLDAMLSDTNFTDSDRDAVVPPYPFDEMKTSAPFDAEAQPEGSLIDDKYKHVCVTCRKTFVFKNSSEIVDMAGQHWHFDCYDNDAVHAKVVLNASVAMLPGRVVPAGFSSGRVER